ncbi:MAG: hypothetical protein H7273_00855 [Polaromonas sp.]|nr:hypothetical protein [Polaromonas sp.]
MTSPLSQPLASNPRRPDTAPVPADPDSQSVAGEEDPGASLDLPAGPHGPPASQTVSMPPGAIHPGDDAAEGTPGTGQAICRACGGSGRAANGPCPACAGSGAVTAGLGGA